MMTELVHCLQPPVRASHSAFSFPNDRCFVTEWKESGSRSDLAPILRCQINGRLCLCCFEIAAQGFCGFNCECGRGFRGRISGGSQRRGRLREQDVLCFAGGCSHGRAEPVAQFTLSRGPQGPLDIVNCHSQEVHFGSVFAQPDLAAARGFCNQQHDWDALHMSFVASPPLQKRRKGSASRVNSVDPNRERNWFQRLLFDPIPLPDERLSDETDGDRDGRDDRYRPKGQKEKNGSGRRNSTRPGRKEENASDDEEDEVMDDIDEMLADDVRYSAWQQKNKARREIDDFQKTGRDPEKQDWEDWLDTNDNSGAFGVDDSGWYYPDTDWEKDGMPRSAPKKPVRGMKRTVYELLSRAFEPQEEVERELEFEERVFRFTSQQSAKFAAILLLVPLLVDFSVHDFVLVPFLKRYVETVPLAAEMLDVRRPQKLKIVKELKLERQRVRFEAEIGKAPPLSEEELADHLRHEALELYEEARAENRAAFASIWSDLLGGSTIFLLLFLNPQQVAIMSMTTDRLFTNVSDTGKAFIIILMTDIFLGYHSSMGWETVVEMVLERYGFEAEEASIYLFVATVPVIMDAFFKLWVFKNFSRVSPSAAATFREMSRH